MKKFLYSLSVICLTLMSCIENKQSEIEKLAIESFKMSYAKEYKDIIFENFKTVFHTQNLCILHVEDNNRNSPTKVEYLFFTQDSKNYEAIQDLSEDSIFVSEPTLKEISKGTIYENLDFAKATFFRAAHYIYTNGREVGNHNTDFSLQIPMETGMWELCDIFDEFGDKISGKCLKLIGKGLFSSSFEKNEKLGVVLFVYDEYNYSFRIIEDGYGLVKDFSGKIKIKDGEGEVHEMYFSSSSAGSIRPSSTSDFLEMREIINKEGELSAVADISGWFSTQKKNYKFKLNLDGLNKAMRYILPDKDDEPKTDSEEINSEIDSESVEEEIDSENEIETVKITRESDDDMESESPKGIE